MSFVDKDFQIDTLSSSMVSIKIVANSKLFGRSAGNNVRVSCTLCTDACSSLVSWSISKMCTEFLRRQHGGAQIHADFRCRSTTARNASIWCLFRLSKVIYPLKDGFVVGQVFVLNSFLNAQWTNATFSLHLKREKKNSSTTNVHCYIVHGDIKTSQQYVD